MQVEIAYITETIKFVEYVETKEDPIIQVVRACQHDKP
jgi:hypothetical protein